MNGLDLCLKVV